MYCFKKKSNKKQQIGIHVLSKINSFLRLILSFLMLCYHMYMCTRLLKHIYFFILFISLFLGHMTESTMVTILFSNIVLQTHTGIHTNTRIQDKTPGLHSCQFDKFVFKHFIYTYLTLYISE